MDIVTGSIIGLSIVGCANIAYSRISLYIKEKRYLAKQKAQPKPTAHVTGPVTYHISASLSVPQTYINVVTDAPKTIEAPKPEIPQKPAQKVHTEARPIVKKPSHIQVVKPVSRTHNIKDVFTNEGFTATQQTVTALSGVPLAIRKKSPVVKPTNAEIKLLKDNAHDNKLKMSWLQIAHIKTLAGKRGIDDWISLIDSKLSYEENKSNIEAAYGHTDTDRSNNQKWRDYSEMAKDYYNQMPTESYK